jgi:hypothetical protein
MRGANYPQSRAFIDGARDADGYKPRPNDHTHNTCICTSSPESVLEYSAWGIKAGLSILTSVSKPAYSPPRKIDSTDQTIVSIDSTDKTIVSMLDVYRVGFSRHDTYGHLRARPRSYSGKVIHILVPHGHQLLVTQTVHIYSQPGVRTIPLVSRPVMVGPYTVQPHTVPRGAYADSDNGDED